MFQMVGRHFVSFLKFSQRLRVKVISGLRFRTVFSHDSDMNHGLRHFCQPWRNVFRAMLAEYDIQDVIKFCNTVFEWRNLFLKCKFHCCSLDEHLEQNRILLEPHLGISFLIVQSLSGGIFSWKM